ncbi:TPA: hypothetical protein ACH3X2_007531 [Trebouxia sp. C0005]|nr:MAG: hypothetical protein FRX49_00642 [Trebouxia sp. A1-2]
MYILQAATQAIKEGDLWLCYGSAVEEAPSSQDHEAELRRLGQKIVDCCRDAGLTVHWTGDAEDMIIVKGLSQVDRQYLSSKLFAREMNRKEDYKQQEQHSTDEGKCGECESVLFSCCCGQVSDISMDQHH